MKKILHIHIDPLGGISGDMFISAIINADKKFINIVQKTKNKILKNATLTIQRTKKNHIEGTSLNISLNKRLIRHQSYQDIVTLIAKSKLSKDTKQLASEMFTRLAKVEAKVHGTTINKVTFHELGAWDSILDITLSAEIINYFNRNHKTTWSCGEVPLGKGSIDTAHGKIPLPAPATSLLLKGVNVIDDGIKGERVTPTGALILSTLKPKYNIFSHTV